MHQQLLGMNVISPGQQLESLHDLTATTLWWLSKCGISMLAEGFSVLLLLCYGRQ